MKLSLLTGKKILLVGYGLEGKATHEFLRTKLPDVSIDIADQKNDSDYLKKQKNYDLVIKSPGIPKRLIEVSYTTATNIFFANTRGMVIGVTGSKGKSTTSSLIYSILKEAGKPVHLVGNIGKPALTELMYEKGDQDIYVFELSSYQLDDIEYSPHIAVFINIFPEHMDYHGSMEEYWNAKKRIVAHSTADDFFVYNNSYNQLVELSKETKARPTPFVTQMPFPETDIPLLGKHNIDNVRAAVTVAKLFAVSDETMHKAIKQFKALPHRLEHIGTFRGISFYDDAISTTPESTMAALNSLPSIATIFLGGQDRGYEFTSLVDRIISAGVKTVVCFPESGKKIAQTIRDKTAGIAVIETNSMEEAVKFAYEHTTQDSICLLSTASPSYSLWKNFEEKGNEFAKYVRQYGNAA